MATIRGKNETYKLIFSINAIIDIEEALGIEIHQITTALNLSMLRTILMYALHYGEGRDFTKKEAGEVMDDIVRQVGVEEMVASIVKILDKSLTKETTSEEKTEGK